MNSIHLASLAILAFLSVAFDARATPAASDDTFVEKCGVVYADDSGASQTKALSSLRVADQTASSPTFTLPADAPPNVQAITCGRSDSLVPRENDYKVLLAGFPFSIVAPDGERVGVLTIVEGRLRFEMLVGTMTESEIAAVGTFLDASQLRMSALDQATKSPQP